MREGVLLPRWYGERDHPWIRELVDAYATFVGERRQLLDEHLSHQSVANVRMPPGWRVAARILDRVYSTVIEADVSPQRARAALFEAAADRRPRAEALELAASELGIDPQALEQALFADLAGERVLREAEQPVHATSLALQCNLALVQALLKSSSRIHIAIEGNAHAVVRHAKLRRLICTVAPRGSAAALLEVSGPLALFRRTALYGRHLAELVPQLPWSRDFELRADCVWGDRQGRLTLTPADPIPPGRAPRKYDSRLEQRFARDFSRASSDWILIREPQPVAADGTLIFPDFAIVHRRRPARRWLLEIVGFWTADYLERKFRRLAAAGIQNLILCVDRRRDCGDSLPSTRGALIRFSKRVDAREVLRFIERESSA